MRHQISSCTWEFGALDCARIYSNKDFIHKQLFVERLCRFVNQVVGRNQGFLANIAEILQKYGLQHYLTMYLDTGDFPQETQSTWIKCSAGKPKWQTRLNYIFIALFIMTSNRWIYGMLH